MELWILGSHICLTLEQCPTFHGARRRPTRRKCSSAGKQASALGIPRRGGSDANYYVHSRSPDPPINVLFTMARDGICRIWSPLILQQPASMSMCAIIDPNQWLVSQQQQQSTQYPIHVLDGMEFAMAVEYAASKTVDKNNDANSIRLRRLKEIVRDTADLFFQIQDDGSMIIWGVQVEQQLSIESNWKSVYWSLC